MKTATLLCTACLFLLVGCARQPDPKIAFLESEIKRLEGELVKTNNYVLSMERVQDTQSALIANHGELIKLMAPAANLEQLRQLVIQYNDLARSLDSTQNQKLDVLAKHVFGEAVVK